MSNVGMRSRWRFEKFGLGMNQVVYLKSGMCDGNMLFVLFGADGIS